MEGTGVLSVKAKVVSSVSMKMPQITLQSDVTLRFEIKFDGGDWTLVKKIPVKKYRSRDAARLGTPPTPA